MTTHPDTAHRSGSVRLHNDREAIDALADAVLDGIEGFGYPKSARFAIKLALEEAVANAFVHGHANLPGTPLDVTYDVSAAAVRITVEDHGPGFKPSDIPDPTLDENIASPSGRGLMLMRAYMTEVRHNASGNRVELIYRRS